jgi:hypothetical protein
MHGRNRAAQAACYAIVPSLKATNKRYDVEAVVTTSNPSRHADTQYFNRLETLRAHRSGGSINVKSELRCLWCPQGPIAWMWRARQNKIKSDRAVPLLLMKYLQEFHFLRCCKFAPARCWLGAASVMRVSGAPCLAVAVLVWSAAAF